MSVKLKDCKPVKVSYSSSWAGVSTSADGEPVANGSPDDGMLAGSAPSRTTWLAASAGSSREVRVDILMVVFE
jgi:hypothetical protein